MNFLAFITSSSITIFDIRSEFIQNKHRNLICLYFEY